MQLSDAIKKAKEELKRQRQNAQYEASFLLDSLLTHPDIKEAYTSLRLLEVHHIRNKHNRAVTASDEKNLILAQNKFNKVLKNRGISVDRLNPQYKCKNCFDTGYVAGKQCKCLTELIKDILYGEYLTVNKGRFEKSTEKLLKNRQCYQEAEEYCKAFPKIDKINFLIKGHTGVGKTFLADCIVNALRDRNVNVISVTAYELNKMFFDDFMSEGHKILMDVLINADVLVVDDLGKEPIYKKISLESLYSLLNERQLKEKSTIITTNLEANELLSRYGESILARIANKKTTHILVLTGEDKRLS